MHLLTRSHHPAAPASGMVWKMLFDRQQALLHRWAGPCFWQVVTELGLRRDSLPNLTQISCLVRQRTGWTLLLTDTPVSEDTYYEALGRCELPVVARLRSFCEFDHPPGGVDLFTDLFGRVALLLQPCYAQALHELGSAWKLATTPAAVGLLRRFARATFERGLIAADGRSHFYGTVLLTSPRYLHAAAGTEATAFQPLASAMRYLSQPTPDASPKAVDPEVYFVAESWTDLLAAIQQLCQELVKLQGQAVGNYPLPVDAAPADLSSRQHAFVAPMPSLRKVK
jgi:phenylalanine-4-hydroxylase